ncbi:MAG: 30S ribosomal protein S16 [Bacteroidetes bacterium QS_8_68_28]|nr:MAG: 30S ribosomal protein S16 [Bacteroidetes bacterium QS_8_68_28]
MPVTLRLRRIGRRKHPVWAVVAADNRRARDGRYIEDLGRYYPLEQPSRTELDEQRVMHWLEQGAQPSDTVRSMLSKRGLMLALDLRRQGKETEEIREAVSEHREKHGEGAGEEVSLTAEERRKQALEAERERVAELEAEEERKKKEEERKRREAEEEQEKQAATEAKEAEDPAAEESDEADEQAEARAEDAEATDAEAADAEEAEASADGDGKEAQAAADEEKAAGAEETADEDDDKAS